MNLDEIVRSGEATAPAKAAPARRRDDMVIGGVPSVSLMPRELRAAARARSIRHGIVGAVVVAALLSAGGTVLANTVAGASQDRLTAATADGQTLLRQLAKFRDVQNLQKSIALGEAAAKVGSSTEIDWQAQLAAIEQDMPSSNTVQTVLADSVTPFGAYPQGTTPLELPRAATLQVTVAAPTVTGLPVWLRKLRSIPAYADATASVGAGDGGGYSVLLTIHLSPKAMISTKAAQ